MRMLSTTPR